MQRRTPNGRRTQTLRLVFQWRGSRYIIYGVPVNHQEILNAVYSGPFVTLGKAEFSNSQNAHIQKWSAYISGSVNRQDFLECALDWVSKGNIDDYMSRHRKDKNISELKAYFNSVMDWVSAVFVDVES